MIKKEEIWAVVVWYGPTEEQSLSLCSYIHEVSHVVIVDNSANDNSPLLASLPQTNYTYLPQGENTGVATALNIGCRYAIGHGASWILTMDQDSRWEKELLAHYIELALSYPGREQVGVFSPRQDYSGHMPHYDAVYEEKVAVMTSGCLISVKGFEATGGFRDELFIDEVDNEYCMHIRRLGMKVVIINSVLLAHRLGEKRTIRFLGLFRKEYIDHAPFRFYYMTRNILYLNYLYPEYRPFTNKRLRKMLKRIVLYDQQHKWAALRMCWRGFRDVRSIIAIEKKHH